MDAILFTKQIGALDVIIERKRYYKGGTASLNESVGVESKHFILPSPSTIDALGKDNARVAVAIVLPCNLSFHNPEDCSTLILLLLNGSLFKNLLTASFVIFLI